ncbi:hypothetical protein BDZ89DRAFT_1046509 [Hymenopellis radicata]|nr:hypothetical protein BDZ89DRAFT_1046509 [Hymenopellis radicata]
MESTSFDGNTYLSYQAENYQSQQSMGEYTYGAPQSDSYLQSPHDYTWPSTYASPDMSSETLSYSAADIPDMSSETLPYSAADIQLYEPVPLPQLPAILSMGSGFPSPHSSYDSQPPPPFEQQAKPIMMFPTPSEMLSDLAQSPPNPSLPSGSRTLLPHAEKTESARKARRQTMANSLGFLPTDIDTLSSHEKKRHYLECLERYVVYLHDQLKLVGAQPVALERVSNYQGLSSRSIRTLLVYMEHRTRRLNLQRISEEQKFVSLRDTALKQQATADALRQVGNWIV